MAEIDYKAEVLKVFPDATPYHTSDNYWTILKTNSFPRQSIYSGGVQYMESEAWQSAYSRLPQQIVKAQQPGAIDFEAEVRKLYANARMSSFGSQGAECIAAPPAHFLGWSWADAYYRLSQQSAQKPEKKEQ